MPTGTIRTGTNNREEKHFILNCKTYLLAQKKKGINFYIHHFWTKLREIRLVSWMKRPRDELLEIFPCRLLIFLTRVERDYYNNRASLRHINGIMLRIIQYDTFAKRIEYLASIYSIEFRHSPFNSTSRENNEKLCLVIFIRESRVFLKKKNEI